MTYEEFLEALRKTPRDWRIENFRFIRRGNPEGCMALDECQCPLAAVFGSARYEQCFSERVIEAADADQYHDTQTRSDLLEACGLAVSA